MCIRDIRGGGAPLPAGATDAENRSDPGMFAQVTEQYGDVLRHLRVGPGDPPAQADLLDQLAARQVLAQRHPCLLYTSRCV